MSLSFEIKAPRRDFDLTLSGKFGESTVGIFGPSGAGKTSLFRFICGLESPVHGLITLNGKLLLDTRQNYSCPPHERGIGVVFQEKLLFPHLSVKKNLLFGNRYRKKEQGLTLEETADLLDLTKLMDSMPGEISGGEQQRTAIGRALLSHPDLLLLDEPFNAVDSSLRSTILPYLKRLQEKLKIPMLVISHDLPDIQSLTNEIYIIDKGQKRGHGSIMELLSRGQLQDNNHDFTNILTLSRPQKDNDGLYTCRLEGTVPGTRTFIKVSGIPHGESSFTKTIRPGEIALSTHRCKGISMQNQIEGTVTKILIVKGGRLCLVDIGQILAVLVTEQAFLELELQKGCSVFCLFKSHSLE